MGDIGHAMAQTVASLANRGAGLCGELVIAPHPEGACVVEAPHIVRDQVHDLHAQVAHQ